MVKDIGDRIVMIIFLMTSLSVILLFMQYTYIHFSFIHYKIFSFEVNKFFEKRSQQKFIKIIDKLLKYDVVIVVIL